MPGDISAVRARGAYVIGFVNLVPRSWAGLLLYACEVGKGTPKEEGQPFRAVFLLPLESIIFSADRGTPPGCARGLTAKVA